MAGASSKVLYLLARPSGSREIRVVVLRLYMGETDLRYQEFRGALSMVGALADRSIRRRLRLPQVQAYLVEAGGRHQVQRVALVERRRAVGVALPKQERHLVLELVVR
jgi:hypothetical protein